LEEKINTSPPSVSDEDRAKTLEQYTLMFAKLAAQRLVNLERNNNTKSSFSSHQRSELVSWLKAPEAGTNAKNLRNASIYMFMRSPQYRRLCSYNAFTPMWCYTLSPVAFDPNKAKPDTLRKQYYKTAAMLENMNIKHEMQKATLVAWVEGVFYGLIWSTTSSFFIQRVNPDICTITSVLDGVYNFAIDVSLIREEDLVKYPEYITTMLNEYKRDGIKLKEVPPEYSFCIKVDESEPGYVIPPFASTLPYLYDIDSKINLTSDRDDVENYKALHLQIPTDDKGIPTMDEMLSEKYYNMAGNNIAEAIGLFMSPFKVDTLDFQRKNGTSNDDMISQAEEHFWSAGGTSYLLFGSPKNNTSRGIELSIDSDSGIMFAVMNQCERLINRYLKLQSSASKFKITFLPVTIYNWQKVIKEYTSLATYGVPVKAAICAIAGLQPMDIPGMNFVETELLNVLDLKPMASSHTQSASPGRPSNESNGEPLSDSGEQTADDDENANR